MKAPRPLYANPMDFPRAHPIPPFTPNHMFQDNIFVAPTAPGTQDLNFDRMDLREQGKWPTENELLRHMMAQQLLGRFR